MSRSIHVTLRNFKDLPKKEIIDQAMDPNSDLNLWAKKGIIKKKKIANRIKTGNKKLK
jgi:hypothetical protein